MENKEEKALSRGLRNANPGNIRISATKYMGEIQPSQDKAFKQFSSMAWGYRAMFVLLYTYQVKNRLNTLRGMINRYAPPVENNTNGYISRVAREADIDADATIDALDGAVMRPVVAAMSAVENGVPAVLSDVWAGWDLFLQHKP